MVITGPTACERKLLGTRAFGEVRLLDGSRLRLLVDMDGVIYRGGRALPGLTEFFEWISTEGHAYMLVTNNASRSPEEIAVQLHGMDIHVPSERIVTSAMATAVWLREQAPERARVLCIGGSGLWKELYGNDSAFVPDDADPEWVVVGLDRNVTYARMAAASLAVQRGARYVATNPDLTFPAEDGLLPGAGALQAVITLSAGVQPVVIGKPEPKLFEMSLRLMPDSGEVVVLGDRLDTDIEAGMRIGARTVLLLTGVSTRAEAATGDVRPDEIYSDIPEMLRHWRRRE